jgi:hypothetical protein
MTPGDRAGLTASDAHRWLRGLQWFHAARFAVMAAVVGATIVAAVVPTGCTPEGPCGLSPQGTWWLALLFASLVLLITSPGLGCLSALALGVLGAGYDPALSARGWWAAQAALSAAALVFLLLIRVHQHRVAATIQPRISLPGRRTANTATWDETTWFTGLAAVAGIVLLVIDHYQRVSQALLSFASQLGMIGELNDQTPWLSFAILAWLLAAAAALRPARRWWAHRRPVDGDLRGILVSTRWPAQDVETIFFVEIFAADGSGLRLSVLRSPVPFRAIVEPDKHWTRPELTVITGQFWYGGVVQLSAPDGAALADAVVGLPQLTLLGSWHTAPSPSRFEDEELTVDVDKECADSRAPLVIDGNAVAGAPAPFVAYGRSHRPIRWSLYALLAVMTVGLVVVWVRPSEPDWWTLVILPGIFLLCLVPFLPHLARAHVAVNQDGVIVVNSLSTYRIPWSAIDMVELRLARGLWQRGSSKTPDDDWQIGFRTPDRVILAEVPVGSGPPTGGMAELVNRIVDYRRRILLTDGHTATAVMVTGAAAHWPRGRPSANDSLPPADIAGRVQDHATARQPPTGGKRRFGRC